MVSARGYIHNTLGNIVLRAAHPGYPHGVAYTKPATMSLEEVEAAQLVVTDIPTSRILHGDTLKLSRHDAHGALLVLDEVLTGFRTGYSGYWGLTGGAVDAAEPWTPDLLTFGKVIGGGMPTAALGGRADVILVPAMPAFGLAAMTASTWPSSAGPRRSSRSR